MEYGPWSQWRELRHPLLGGRVLLRGCIDTSGWKHDDDHIKATYNHFEAFYYFETSHHYHFRRRSWPDADWHCGEL
jgi:hypothetical protein